MEFGALTVVSLPWDGRVPRGWIEGPTMASGSRGGLKHCSSHPAPVTITLGCYCSLSLAAWCLFPCGRGSWMAFSLPRSRPQLLAKAVPQDNPTFGAN